MALTPLDIHNKEFPTKFRGYDPDTVDEFLDQIIREFEALIKESAHLKDQVESLNLKLEQYRNLEETINKTLVVAQDTAEEIKSNARREAELQIQEARLQAERIIEAGQSKARRIMDENADLSRVAQILRTQVRATLQAQLEAIDGVRAQFAALAPNLIPGDRVAAAVQPPAYGEEPGDDER
ncbi:MAG TPA: DivIVA domain-containing protein [Symbiobacteriaceae bacterium]|jgi:cell division initiation protein